MALRKGFRQLVDEAKSRITTIGLEEARARHGRSDVVFVDLRDVRELEREGAIPGAFHCPRGMLEFWIDPESPYYKDVFAPGKEFVFYCNAGWRSALADGLGPRRRPGRRLHGLEERWAAGRGAAPPEVLTASACTGSPRRVSSSSAGNAVHLIF